MPPYTLCMRLSRLLALLVIVAGISSHAQVFEGLDLTPKKKQKTRVAVTLSAPVPGARVFIDGEPEGALPLAEKFVKPGEHTLKIERQGYQTIEATITAVANKKTDFAYTLEPVGAVVTVESSTAGATCSIDGSAAEPLPLTKVLGEGKHVVVVAANGFASEQRTIDATLGVDLTETFTLVAGEDRPAQVNLEPSDRDSDLELELATNMKGKNTPLYARWYVWAGVGAVVVGAIATAVAVTQGAKPTPDPSIVCGGSCDATVGWPVR
jgi:hypothetical protein